ncbi:hypothetical protein Rleg4DRAFT_4629 [Rhizobium leguminosarum bv. trifolii WSM2297]|uniref:Uncharacterized protein n=1 Tax=Rhizobium leguminosarum bv. trifolii WSM2297 TaxID=754762 RepID=J0KYL8_RHILT|nr:hypothetical protein [Rhizobium leguminosarum]EJC82899.1 hypothetical protein Rleg4DRAFT_4629 [Rhizobium leguminosarum bv. trifolii WSM2297]
MPPSPDRPSVRLLAQSALSRVVGITLVVAILWLAIHWAVVLP